MAVSHSNPSMTAKSERPARMFASFFAASHSYSIPISYRQYEMSSRLRPAGPIDNCAPAYL